MCGITGAVWSDPKLFIAGETLRRMTDALRHRGPDDEGTYLDSQVAIAFEGEIRGVALGHRRLSIIDLSLGHQPLGNEDGSIQIVFNGEIYNFRQLRKRLEGAGHTFRTNSDTEVLVHLYEDEGVDFLRHLEGMFALALWDSRNRQLVLARDRLGKKPLFYRLESGRLIFASELKSILQVPGITPEIDPAAVDEYLTYQYIPHPNTIYRDTFKLPPAHYAVYRGNRVELGCYWKPDFNQEIDLPVEEYCHELRRLMTAAVEKRLESEVPLGAFLSGGVDSSIVVGLMQQLCKEPVKTFSIGFPIKEFDESAYARLVAQTLGTDHHEFRVEPDAVGVLSELVWFYDEPFADSSAIPTYYVSKMTREHVTVALTGDGGDELFAGYPRYRAVELGRWFDAIPKSLQRLLAGPYWQRLPSGPHPKSFLRKLQRLMEAMRLPPQRRYLEWVCIFNEARRAELYHEDFVSRLPNSDPYDFLRAAMARSSQRDLITQVSLADLVTYLPCALMTKVDIASMANSLECRQPFLDHAVVELAARMPIGLKYRYGKGKQILLKTFSDLLPRAVQKRPKMGFGIPLAHWFRHELRDYSREILLDSSTLSRGYFRPEGVTTLVEEHQSGQRDHSYRLWSLLVLELWHRRWVG